MFTHGGTRTPNLQFRRPTPYPLGHAGFNRRGDRKLIFNSQEYTFFKSQKSPSKLNFHFKRTQKQFFLLPILGDCHCRIQWAQYIETHSNCDPIKGVKIFYYGIEKKTILFTLVLHTLIATQHVEFQYKKRPTLLINNLQFK